MKDNKRKFSLNISNDSLYSINKNIIKNLFRNLERDDLIRHKHKKDFLKDNYVINLIFVGSKEIKDLNKEYRKKNKVTDVLSFELSNKDGFVLPDTKKGDEKCLGEIYISYPEAIKKSKELNISKNQEMCWLFVHGLLHLLGYDHKVEVEKIEMRNKEKEFLKR